ncbi:MAG: dual specificity protein phosphatase family protein [Acidobacteriia bacterium]|nr:dual specificity protein phosphatase family protein [Terriglobia bacterium]
MTTTVWIARVFGLAVLLAVTLCVSAEPRQASDSTASSKEPAIGRKLQEKGLPNFGEVTTALYRGGQPAPEGFEKLAQMGIDIVVDAGRSKKDQKQIEQLGMRYVPLPWYCPHPKDDVFARFLELVRENPNRKIFVHCRLGDDRTGMMIAAYRMGIEGWTAEQAMKEMQFFGYTAVHHVMCPGLAGYEKSFPERLRKNPVFAERKPAQTQEKSK